MNQHLGPQMKRYFTRLTTLTFLLGTLPVTATEQRMREGSSLYFETKLENFKKNQNVKVRIKDGETGKQANIMLSPSDLNPDLAKGLFQLRFGDKAPNIELLDFYIGDTKMTPFTPGPNNKNTYRVFLFSDAAKTNEFADKFYSDARQYYYPAAPPPDIPATVAKKVFKLDVKPAPAEIPKAAPLKIKSDEQQKIENEAKLNLEALAAQKRAAQLAELAKLKADEIKARKNKAQSLAIKALEKYRNGAYKDSVQLFAEATTLDPESDTYYFQYGVALYKTENYKKSLATLSIAEGQTSNQTELTYFKALNHMKLEEYDQALEEFSSVQDENDVNLSATSSFFAGNIAFRREKYPEARGHLEYTLDHSKDPKTDQQAENLIEEIDRIEAFQSKSKEIYHYSLTAGTGYDQNVLNIVTQNAATNNEAIRFSYSGNFLYRLLYDYRNEFSADFNLSDMYSVKTNFHADASIQTADPLVISLGLPYHHQSIIGKTAVTWGFTPQYQSISMNLDGSGRKTILTSTLGKLDATFMRNALWLSSYRLEYSLDQSGLTAATADDNLSGIKTTLGTTQTRLLDQKGIRTWNYSLDYTLDQTQGKNYQYTKWAAGLGYGDKFYNDHDGSLKLDYSNTNYAQASTARIDNLLVLTATAGKEYWPAIYLSYSSQYNMSTSVVSSYNYDKFAFNVSLTYSGSKKKK